MREFVVFLSQRFGLDEPEVIAERKEPAQS
jgi:hypothetical protein